MKFVQPITFNDATLLSTNVSNDAGITVWSIGQSIAEGDVRRYEAANKHWIVRALQAHTTSELNAPTGLNTDAFWVYLYDSNPYRMFDNSSTSQSVQLNNITAKISAINDDLAVNSAYALNVFGTDLTINMYDLNGELVYNNSQSLISTSGITDWDEWLFSPVQRIKDVVFTDLPAYYLSSVELILNNAGAEAKCGLFGAGYLWDLGFTELGAKRGLRDYSVKTADGFGNYTVTQRKKSKTITITSMVENSKIDQILDVLDDVSSIGTVWLGTDVYRETTVYGFYKDAYATMVFDSHTRMNFEIEELS